MEEIGDFIFLFVLFYDRMRSMRKLRKSRSIGWFSMRRFFALLLCFVLLFTFTACGSSDAPASTEAAAAPTAPATEQAAPTQAPTEVPTEAPADPTAEMAAVTLLDNNDVTFTVTKAENSEHLGMMLHVNCVNKTDRTLIFSWDMVSVCGYMYDPLWSVEVAAGKSANSTVDLDTYALENMGITSVDEVTFTLRIFDSENWMEAPIVEDVFTIYPTGLTADTLVLPPRPETIGQSVAAEDENILFVIENVEESAAGYTLQVYMQNKSDRNLLYAWDLVSVNGMMIDPFWAMSVAAGKNACARITFHRSDLENSGIAGVTNIEFTLLVSDYDDWEAGHLLEKICTYTSAG